MTRASKLLEVSREELEALIERAQAGPLDEADGRKLQAVVETLCLVTPWLENKTTTIARLRQMIFGASTEKTRQVIRKARDPPRPTRHHHPSRRRRRKAIPRSPQRRRKKAMAAMAPRLIPAPPGSRSATRYSPPAISVRNAKPARSMPPRNRAY
jgi:hypothetical protein